MEIGYCIFDDQNRLGINANAEDDPQNATNNPYNRLENTTGNVQTNTLKTRLYAILTPLKGLTIQGFLILMIIMISLKRANLILFRCITSKRILYIRTEWDKPAFIIIMKRLSETLWMRLYDMNENFFDDRLSTNLMVGASQEQYKRQYFSATRKRSY